MSFKDLAFYFSRIQICKINDSYNYSFLKCSHKINSFSLARLIIESDGFHTISVAQKDKRCFLRNTEYDYSFCRIILIKIDVNKTDIDNPEKF